MNWTELGIGHMFTYYDTFLGSTEEEGFAGRAIKISDEQYTILSVRYEKDWNDFEFPSARFTWGAKVLGDQMDLVDEGEYQED
jgi:hypothetical protein